MERNQVARFGYDGISVGELSTRKGLRLPRGSLDREDRSLLFTIVGTGHRIRVEGSSIEAEVLIVLFRPFVLDSRIRGSAARCARLAQSRIDLAKASDNLQ